MGDRANVKIDYGHSHGKESPPVYFYTHWDGTDLPKIVRNALIRGQSRWDDSQYLPRIIFCEMVKDDLLANTGYGISTYLGDGDDRIITINTESCTVTDYDGKVWSYYEYCKGG